MKFRCKGCGALFYSDRPLQVCDFCSGVLEDVTPQCTQVICAEREVEVRVIHGIPKCDYFVLNNAPGSRCLYFALPRRCAVARLPEYHPRTGIILEADHRDGREDRQ
jgi:rubredoxin